MTAPCCPYIPTSKQQQDCNKELMRFVIDAELPFKKLDNPQRASRGQLGCSLKWRPWVKFEQQNQEQQAHQQSCFLVCPAALDNGQRATQTSCFKQLKQRTRSLCKPLAFSLPHLITFFSTNSCRALTNQLLDSKKPRVHSLG